MRQFCFNEDPRGKPESDPANINWGDLDSLRNSQAHLSKADADVHAILSCLCGTAQFPELL